MPSEPIIDDEVVAPRRKDWTKGWPALERPPDNAKSWWANGKEYRVSRTVSFDRYEAYELLQVEVGLARNFEQVTASIRRAYDLCNEVATGKPVFADLAVELRDLLVGCTLVSDGQTNAVLRMAALFINREGEDVRYIDESVIESKIEDWRIGGIDMAYFFQFALRSIPGFIEAYRAISLDTSMAKPEAERGAVPESMSRPGSRPFEDGTSVS